MDKPIFEQVWQIDGANRALPPEVKKEIKEFWLECELGNGETIVFDVVEEGELYPNLSKLILENNLTVCQLHYWW